MINEAAVTGVKTCPYCAETIKERAIVCRFCGRELGAEVPAVSSHKMAEVPRQGLTIGDLVLAVMLGPVFGVIVGILRLTGPRNVRRSLLFMLVSLLGWPLLWIVGAMVIAVVNTLVS